MSAQFILSWFARFFRPLLSLSLSLSLPLPLSLSLTTGSGKRSATTTSSPKNLAPFLRIHSWEVSEWTNGENNFGNTMAAIDRRAPILAWKCNCRLLRKLWHTDQMTDRPTDRPTNQPTYRPTSQQTDIMINRLFTFPKGKDWNFVRIWIKFWVLFIVSSFLI